MSLIARAGWPVEVIAQVVCFHPRTVQRWLDRYAAVGVAGLPDRPRSGRPRFGSPRVTARLAARLSEAQGWMVPRLRRRLRLTLSLDSVRRRVREVAQGRRPRLIAKGDPDAAARWAAIRHALAALPAGAVILAEDECHLDLLAWLRSTWILRGQRQRGWTPGQNQRRTRFGALDIRTGAWWERVTRRASSREFIAFLEQLLRGYPTAPVLALVVDDVIIHSSQAVQAWLRATPGSSSSMGRAPRPAPTRSSGSGAASSGIWRTPPRPPWPVACGRPVAASTRFGRRATCGSRRPTPRPGCPSICDKA
jgi:transposase